MTKTFYLYLASSATGQKLSGFYPTQAENLLDAKADLRRFLEKQRVNLRNTEILCQF